MNRNDSGVEGPYVGWTTPFFSTVAIVSGGRVKRRPSCVADAIVDEPVRWLDNALFVHHCDRERWAGKASSTLHGRELW